MYVQTHRSAYQDSNGDWVSSSRWQLFGSCREETNGKGTLRKSEEMESFSFSSLIQLPFGSARVEEGFDVIVSNSLLDVESIEGNIEALKSAGSVRVYGRCMKFDEGRFHNRLWLN